MLRTLRRSIATLALAGLLASPAFAAAEGWTEDFDGAKSTAETQSKDLFLEFTGSDWCPPCKRLNEAVFSKDAFTEGASKHFVLVKLDFPRSKEQSDELKAQNQKLQQAYSIRGYPTVILADADGRPYAQTGFRPGGPDEYLAHLSELQKVRIERDKHMTAANDAEGVEKAKHLDQAMEAVGMEMALGHYDATIQQIIKLDADNAAGLKDKYQDMYTAKKLEQEMEQIMAGARNDPKGTVEKIDAFLAKDGLPAPNKQMALAMKSQIQMFMLDDKESAKTNLLAAIEADPESQIAEQLRGAYKRFFGEAESQ